MKWERKYLIIKNKDDGLDWRLKYGEQFEIITEIDDFYFVWAYGALIAFPKYGKYQYEIKKEDINTE